MAMKPPFDTRDMSEAQIAKKMKDDFDARRRDMETRDTGFGSCPTIKIRSNERGHPEGFTEINLSDFNPKKHKPWNEGDTPPDVKQLMEDAELTLNGPNNLPATVDVGGDGEIALGDIVREAQEKSSLSVKEWNAQVQAQINDACVMMVYEMTTRNREAKKAAASKPRSRAKPAGGTPQGFA